MKPDALPERVFLVRSKKGGHLIVLTEREIEAWPTPLVEVYSTATQWERQAYLSYKRDGSKMAAL